MSTSYLENPSAGLVPRIAAMGYDFLMLIAVWMLVSFLHIMVRGEPIEGQPSGFQYTLFPLLVLSTVAFYSWFWTHGGQTLGMRAWRIKVVHQKLDGTRITYSQCIVRMAVGTLSLFSLGMGYISVLFNSNSDCWHDTASHTRTIRLPKKTGLY
ncbi:MAG: RDD family protein [Moraxellaceae bacterium]|nr:MAG: RDD family protein [Moraxellaceae bacterium]